MDLRSNHIPLCQLGEKGLLPTHTTRWGGGGLQLDFWSAIRTLKEELQDVQSSFARYQHLTLIHRSRTVLLLAVHVTAPLTLNFATHITHIQTLQGSQVS